MNKSESLLLKSLKHPCIAGGRGDSHAKKYKIVTLFNVIKEKSDLKEMSRNQKRAL